MTKKFPVIFNKKIHTILAVIVITMFSFNTHAMIRNNDSDNQALRREKLLERLSTFEKNIYTETLANGLKVVLYHYKSSPQVFIDMIYNVGSKDETPETYGLAHFIEHMIYKGTQKLSEQDIFHIASKFGAKLNAETSYDTTSYYFITDNKNYPVFLDIFADCMHNATFDEEHIASELHTVFSELKNNDNLDLLAECLPATHPYHHPVIGYKETLFTFNRNMLLQFYKTYYQPHNATLLITGNLDPKTAMPTIRSIFESLPVTHPPSKKPLHFPSCKKDISQKKITRYQPDEKRVNEKLLWRIPSYKHNNFFIANIITKTFPQEPKVFVSIEPQSLAYEGFFTITFYPQQDFFNMKKQSKKQSEKIINETINKIIKKLENISAHGIDPKDLDSYKTKALSYVLHDSEGINNIHAILKKSITNNINLEHNELAWLNELKKINTCTNENIKAFTKKYLQKNVMHSLCVYPLEEESDKIAHQKTLAKTDAYDQALLELHHRTAPIQKPIKALSLSPVNLEILPLPKPQEITLSNGLTIFFIHNQDTSFLEGKLCFKNENALKHFLKETNQIMSFDDIKNLKKNKKALRREDELFFDIYGALVYNEFFKCLANDYEIIIKHFLEIHTTPIDEQAALKKYNENINSSQILNDIISYKKFFNPANMKLIITGDFSKPDSKEKICTLFEQWKNQKEYFDITALKQQNSSPDNPSKTTIDNPTPTTINIPTEEEQILLKAVRKGPSTNMKEEDKALPFLSTLVNAKLLEIRESQGLFYNCSFKIEHKNAEQEQLLTITTQVSKTNYNTVLQCIKDTLKNIYDAPYPQDVFNSTRSQFINYFAIESQDIQRSQEIVKNRIENDQPIDSYHQRIESILRLTPEDITAVAKKYLDPSTWSFIIAGRINK